MNMNELRILTGYGSIDLLNPVPDDVNMMDVVTNLSGIRRWNGCIDFTVAQHSLLVEAILQGQGHNRATCLAGLLHDAHEYVTGDVPAPMVKALFVRETISRDQLFSTTVTTTWDVKFTNIQTRIQSVIENKCGLVDGIDFNAVYAADMEARAVEIWLWLPDSPMRRELMKTYPRPSDETVTAAREILETYRELGDALREYGVEVEV